ncbi:conserved exported hypothetical protein [Roseovarius sp. EC-HK134]|uniref:DUF2155 domain-containing protein n=1 Tax=unclassified Roseovarius TaxID=2614913 RepID=UPI0012525699|nr:MULTISPECIES: DUF2155 domain-containing protein [unclassified Roseovarius]VVT06832.1 conserved exported hypothetical protein [Roseovarius sp. EC-HK134]VVT07593.1 conserved exported hypothetical protein [Roseovarius sp. EC-SD190]
MRALWLALMLCFGAGVGTAQEVAAVAKGALLRGLDKINGSAQDLELANGQSGVFGSLDVVLGECRYPQDDPAADAYAYLTISEQAGGAVIFSGWMLASSPALNALEHPRYDIWVLRCKI